MNYLKILLCDDNVGFLAYFQQKLTFIFQKYNISCKFFIYEDICAEIFDNNYDICYLDIELREGSGFLIAERISKISPNTIIIFTTALSHLALESFRYHPFDFIAKDQIDVELDKKTESLISIISPARYTAHIKGSYISILCDDIICVEKQGNNILFTTITKTVYTERKLLQDFEKEVNKYNCFIKIHRSIFINIKHVIGIDNDVIALSNGKKIRITRRLIKEVNKKYMEFKSRR